VSEQAVLFGKENSLVGVVTDPPAGKRRIHFPGVIFLNSGIVHRVGPNRSSVKMARSLSDMGFVALRFDFSGIGDSRPRRDNLPFVKSAISEVQEAMDLMQELRGMRRFILIGACSGARVSFQTACKDTRVIGAFLINFNAGPDDETAHASAEMIRLHAFRYLKFAAISPTSWWRFLTGKTDYRKMARTLTFQVQRRFTKKKATPQSIQFAANVRLLTERRVSTLFISSEGDVGMGELAQAALVNLKTGGPVSLYVIPKADHTFSSLHDQQRLIAILDKWASDVASNQEAANNYTVNEL
jgi:pimeloyl-ACP methyl ester carboxylesterase